MVKTFVHTASGHHQAHPWTLLAKKWSSGNSNSWSCEEERWKFSLGPLLVNSYLILTLTSFKEVVIRLD